MWRFVVFAILAWKAVEVQSVPVVRAADTTPTTTHDSNDGVHSNQAAPRCTSLSCMNGGTCRTTSEGYVCLCPPLHTGQFCQTSNCFTWWLRLATADSTASINIQLAEKVLKNTMVVERKSTVAELDPALVTFALTGDSNAATHLINCTGAKRESCVLQSPCLNGGQCLLTSTRRHTSATHQFKCHCTDGYRGKFCSKALPRCTSLTCANGGTCKTTAEGYVCICPPLHTGQFCQTKWLDITFVSDTLSSISQLSQELAKQRSQLAANSKQTVQEVAAFMRRFESRLMSSLDERLDTAESSIQTLRLESAMLRNITGSHAQKLSALSNVSKELQSKHNNTTTVPDQGGEVSSGRLPARSTELPTSSPSPSVSQGSVLDANRKSANIQLSNGGRTAVSTSRRNAISSVVGTVGYSSGVWQWRIRVSGIGNNSNLGSMAIGVTTLPVDDGQYTFSYGTAYVWFNNQGNAGLATSQTRSSAKISKWQNGDVLNFTLDCDNHLLHLYLPRTSEKKTIALNRRGNKLYLYLYLYQSGNQVDLL